MTLPWWEGVRGPGLAQGDLLDNCRLPVFLGLSDDSTEVDARVDFVRLIVVTQSCDLANAKAPFVSLCVASTLKEFEADNPKMQKEWENVRKGRLEGLYLLASPEQPGDRSAAYVVDFGHVVSLPFDYLASHAENAGDRWRLRSPFREHFSQAFGRYFMRIGLPDGAAIPRYA